MSSSSELGNAGTRSIGVEVVRPRQQVEKRIKQAILDGELKTGERLPPESELARQFGVSRTTVREALRSLSTQSLIDKVPGAGGGSFVRAVDHQSLGDMLSESVGNLLSLGSIEPAEVSDVRWYLELPAVRLAAQHRTDEDLEELRQIVERQKAISVNDPDVPRLDVDFHSAVAKASRNRVLSSFVLALHEQVMPVRFLDLSEEVGSRSVQQHLRIIRAVEMQDQAEAELAMSDHLAYLRDHMAGDCPTH
ncbi:MULTISPECIES: FadR/GntR family transcriptional regulator [unclassified Aeromicrobium]|uniref:FadR/GntR family transcriptional regulator n=1 Tax=unclassified Aeromicrobium TaxID=2633570 RepID=UPI00288C221C|nr:MULTISPECIES: FadR/GntR family transcriptional regulator [unclassified Aeromicrobium]